MKHKFRITAIILIMFILTQFIGLYVVNSYSSEKVINGEIIKNNPDKTIPYGLGFNFEKNTQPRIDFFSIVFSFVFAFLLIYVLFHLKAKRVMKIWFFVISILAMGITLTALFPESKYVSLIGLILALPLAYNKIYRQEIFSHNLSEILIYPGVAAIFVPLLTLTWAIILLILISIYDAWAVWKSKIMQKMAKFQMEQLNIIAGFMIPYADKKEKQKIKKIKEQIKAKKITLEEAKKKKINIKLAILGGGDIAFPIIISGVVLKTWGVWPAITVIFGALLGLSYLLFFGKNKFYPAMPFISAGIFLAMGISYLIF